VPCPSPVPSAHPLPPVANFRYVFACQIIAMIVKTAKVCIFGFLDPLGSWTCRGSFTLDEDKNMLICNQIVTEMTKFSASDPPPAPPNVAVGYNLSWEIGRRPNLWNLRWPLELSPQSHTASSLRPLLQTVSPRSQTRKNTKDQPIRFARLLYIFSHSYFHLIVE
jgi:hypothetical protein